MQNWIVWNRTVLHISVCKQKLYWIVCNQTVYMYKNGFEIK